VGLAERIGRVGVWTHELERLPTPEARALAREIERLDYGAIWIPEVFSKEVLAHAALVLAWTERVVVATGIANVWARDAVAMANGARTLAEAFPGRFVLGIGVSHDRLVDRGRGGTYARPLAKMRDYLTAMEGARWQGPAIAEPAPIVLAALGPRMLELARDRSAGAHPYFTPVEHTAFARRALGQGPLLAVELAVVLTTDVAKARAVARAYTPSYLRLPNYANNLTRFGFSEAEMKDGGSDRLVDAIVAYGDVDAIAERVHAHREAGADHVCIQPLPMEGAPQADQLRALAPALLRA
jgi:probable F420-dependent oxidoreductase